MKLNESINAHASLHLYQIQLEAEKANEHIEKKYRNAHRELFFKSRSDGQKRRYQRDKGEKQ